ncbi:hypothetical protein SEA_CIRCINUS_6 [Streptomyces phage Circinus]|uniref:Uncharacterized protein n=1 Tax=Streptomyces phage Circinus TaxID=2562189 RepID=A0A4D6E0T6_9CAUD|nr:hypothetical protein SEA_CIRCINUS_6 [Streptomyces phage Circinus]
MSRVKKVLSDLKEAWCAARLLLRSVQEADKHVPPSRKSKIQ